MIVIMNSSMSLGKIERISNELQSLTPKQYEELMLELGLIGKTIGRPEISVQSTQVGTKSAVSHLVAANL